jgi:hypothetical protein
VEYALGVDGLRGVGGGHCGVCESAIQDLRLRVLYKVRKNFVNNM